MKRLSIIIVTYNSEADIFDCVRSIKTHSDLPLSEVELVIVDNKSRAPQPMFQQLRELWGDDIVLIENDRNGGYGQGNNIGLRQSTAPIALIMNPDVRLLMPVFKKAVDRFSDNQDIGMLGMSQMYSETRHSNHSFVPTCLINGYLGLILYAVCNRLDLYIPSCMCIQGSCFFLRKEMFSEAGMFDEDNFMYGEEDDIHYRMKAIFGSCCFAFDKTLRYQHSHHSRIPSLEYEKRMAESTVRLFRKKGIGSRSILRHLLQRNLLLLWKAYVKSKQDTRYKVLSDFRKYLHEEIKKSEK